LTRSGAFPGDENFPLPVVEELRRLGHDVVTVADVGKTGQSLPDEAILLLATADVRALLTLNRKHFVRLHASVPHHAGIIVCTLDLDFAGQARRIHAAIEPLTTLAGCLVREPSRRLINDSGAMRGETASRETGCQPGVSQAHRSGRGSRGATLLEGVDASILAIRYRPSFRTCRETKPR
jgi:hypothetical protein